jgi:hypothetical protein
VISAPGQINTVIEQTHLVWGEKAQQQARVARDRAL